MSWKPATEDEIHQYYQQEFPDYVDMIPGFIHGSKPKQVGISFTEAHPVQDDNIPDRPFIRRGTYHKEGGEPTRSRFDGWTGEYSILRFVQSPAEQDPLTGDKQLVSPDLVGRPATPEAVYYSLDFWDRNWVFGVDLDAKDIALKAARESVPSDDLSDGELREEAGIIDAEPAGFPYRYKDIQQAIDYAFEVEQWFQKRLNAEETTVVYSGQGCHVYLHDNTPYYRYDTQTRKLLSDHLITELDIPIDRQVSVDSQRVMRLPYSLHAGVSRIVTPIESPEFDFKRNSLPSYLNGEGTQTAPAQAESDSHHGGQ